MSVHSDIRSALVTAAKAACALPIAFENQPFQRPEDGSPWASCFLLHNPKQIRSMGSNGQDLHTGVMQIDLKYPLLSGEAAQAAMAGAIDDYFQAGRRQEYGSHAVTFVSCSRSRGREVAGWWQVSMSIEWRAFAQRN